MKKGENILPFLHGCSLQVLKALLRSVVGLDGFSLDDHARVGFLPVLTLGGDRSCDVAGGSAEGYDR